MRYKYNLSCVFCVIQARLHVSELVLKQIASMNSLDVELYKHAQKIFVRQHQVMDQKPPNSTLPVSFIFPNI